MNVKASGSTQILVPIYKTISPHMSNTVMFRKLLLHLIAKSKCFFITTHTPNTETTYSANNNKINETNKDL
jgi:hypothetical protein